MFKNIELTHFVCSSLNASGGLNLQEMTFHEIVKKMNQLLGSGGKNSALIEQQLNQRSIQFLVDLCFKITEGFDGHVKAELLQKCNQLVSINHSFPFA